MESVANTRIYQQIGSYIKLDGQANDYVSNKRNNNCIYNFTSMAKWIRVIYIAPNNPGDVGTITKVLVRN